MWFHFFLGNHGPTGKATLYDMMEWLTAGLNELNHEVTVGDTIAPNAMNIIWENFGDADEQIFKDHHFEFGLIATEIPVGRSFNWLEKEPWLTRRRSFDRIAPRAKFIWSMVEKPVKTYERWAPSGYLELGFSEKIVDPVFSEEPEFDFGFYGLSITPHRNKILKRLKKHFTVITPDRFLTGHDLNRFIASLKIGVCLKHSPQWTIPSPARTARLLHAKRGIAAEYTPVRTRASTFVPMVQEHQDFAEFCLESLRGPWKQRAEDAYEGFRSAMPMKEIMEQLLDKTLSRSPRSSGLSIPATLDDGLRDPILFAGPDPHPLYSEGGYNFVLYAGRFYALSQSLGEVDVTVGPQALAERYGAEQLIVADTADGARARIEAIGLAKRLAALEAEQAAIAAAREQVELLGSCGDFNLVAHGGYVYALNQSLGEVDVTVGPQALAERYGAEQLIVADTADGARARIEAIGLAKRLAALEAEQAAIAAAREQVELLSSCGDFNLVAHGGYVYALNQSLGEVDVTVGPQALAERYGAEQLIVADTADGARARIEAIGLAKRLAALEAEQAAIAAAREQVELLGSCGDFNLVAHGGYVYALSQSLGEVDVTVGPQALAERYGAEQLIVADTADGARARIEAIGLAKRLAALEAEQAAIAAAREQVELLGSCGDFNLVAHGGHIYALSQSLGEVDVTVGPQALAERYGAEQLIVADTADGARARIEAIGLAKRLATLEAEQAAIAAAREQVELLGSCGDFNLVAHGGHIYALSQSLGEVDVTVGPQALAERYGAEQLIVADTADGARARIEAIGLAKRLATLEAEQAARPTVRVRQLVIRAFRKLRNHPSSLPR